MSDPQKLNHVARRLTAILAARGIAPGSQPGTSDGEADPADAVLRAADARIPARYREARTDHPQVAAWTRRVLAAADGGSRRPRRVATGPSLLLIGPTGTGKTHLAYGAVRELLAAGVRVRWTAVTSADLHARLRPRPAHDSERAFTELARSPLLLVDDLGAAKTSEWTEEVTYRLVNHRYERCLPTVFTTNLAVRDLRDALGDRVASRLAEMADRVVLTGADRRRTA